MKEETQAVVHRLDSIEERLQDILDKLERVDEAAGQVLEVLDEDDLRKKGLMVLVGPVVSSLWLLIALVALGIARLYGYL